MGNRRTGWRVLLMISILMLSACSQKKSVEEYVQDGRKYVEQNDLSKAIAALEEALKKDPSLAEAHRLLGEALGRSGRWPEAVTQFEAYQALAKEDAAAYFLLGLMAMYVRQEANSGPLASFIRYPWPPFELLYKLAAGEWGKYALTVGNYSVSKSFACIIHSLMLTLVYGIIGILLLCRREYSRVRD